MKSEEALEVLRWHLRFSNLGGMEAKLLIFAVLEGIDGDGVVSISYGDACEALGASKTSVVRGLHSLIEKNALCVDCEASGRGATKYKIRTTKALNKFYLVDAPNPKRKDWESELNLLFGEMLDKYRSIGDDCLECKEIDGACHKHKHAIKLFEGSDEFRKYLLWLEDNPKPKNNIQTINGIIV